LEKLRKKDSMGKTAWTGAMMDIIKNKMEGGDDEE
jgi:hypothetical protein